MIAIPAWIGGRLEPVEKLRVHREGLRHPAVSVFVNAGGRTLLQRRAEAKYHSPGLWANACCTHPHWGEPPEQCAARRLREELGIEGLALVPRDQVEYRAAVGGGLVEHEVVSLFVAEAPPGLEHAPDPEEVAALRWVTLDELRAEIAARPEDFTPWLRIYLAEHGEQIFGRSAGSVARCDAP
jgi:isopentenyl-diphosphate Delta-isomerase